MEFSATANEPAEEKPLIYFPVMAWRGWYEGTVQLYSILRSIDNDNGMACQIRLPLLDFAVSAIPRPTFR